MPGRPEADEGIRRWRWRLYAGTGVAIAVYLWLACLRPGTLAWDPYAIQDDARQFLLWMPRLADPELLRGDFMAAYWHAVSPPLYRLPFGAAAALGLDPVLFGRFLAPALLLLAAWGAWRVALDLTERPLPAFVAAAFTMGFLVHEDSIFTASPRAFGSPLLLLFLHGLLRGRPAVMLGSLFLLASIYPPPAVVAITMLGLSRIETLRPLRVDLSRGSILLVGAAGLAGLIGAAPFLLQTGHWGPTLTLAEARAMPNLMDPGARSTIVDEAGRIGWFCSWRMGYVPTLVPCGMGIPAAPLWNFLLLLPLLVTAGMAVAGRPDEATARRNRLYVLALAAGTIWYAIAVLLAFRLHLPSRYSQRILEVLEWLAIGQWLGLWIEARRRRSPARPGTRAASALIGAAIAISFLSPVPGMKRPTDYALIRFIAALPKSTMIAGVSEDLNFVPALTGRAVLATPEHAIPYQLGYFLPLRDRLAASLLAISTPDPGTLAAILARYRVDYLLVEADTLRAARIPGRYPSILPVQASAATQRLRTRVPAVAAGLPACVAYWGRSLILLDARCLAGRARLRAGTGRPSPQPINPSAGKGA